MLDVRVPQPDAVKADARRLGAAVAPLERAPFTADVHVGRAGNRPVQRQQLDLGHRFSSRSEGTGQATAGPQASPAIERTAFLSIGATHYATALMISFIALTNSSVRDSHGQ